MKTLTTTTPGNLFNLEGILTAIQEPGLFASEAYQLLNSVSEEKNEINECPTSWSDIMMNVNNGKLYAIWSTDSLTTHEGLLQYIELDKEDCPEAFEKAKHQIISE